MSIKSDLRKEGIQVIKQLNTLNVVTIATHISKKLTENFPEQNFNYHEIFSKISRLNMYIANMPNGIAAKYFYKNNSIYFSETTDLENISDVAIHECIHSLQSQINSNNKLVKLGLCDFTDLKLSGMALNEAAVQLMTMKCTNSTYDMVKYFDIELPSCSPDYYALECNLVYQMAYITGEYVLYNSTFYGNDNFKNKFITLTSKEDFEIIRNNINSIMYLEDELNLILNEIQNSDVVTTRIAKLMKKTNTIKETIKKKFMLTQNRIFTSYFDKQFESLYTPKSMENFRNSLYNYRNIIGVTDDYTFFNDYYISKMALLEEKYDKIPNTPMELVIVKDTLFARVVRKIRALIGLNANSNYNYNDINMK